jgi:hypothetical protein
VWTLLIQSSIAQFFAKKPLFRRGAFFARPDPLDLAQKGIVHFMQPNQNYRHYQKKPTSAESTPNTIK